MKNEVIVGLAVQKNTSGDAQGCWELKVVRSKPMENRDLGQLKLT